MVIKLTKLTDAYPDSGFNSHITRSHLFAHAGISFLRACAAVDSSHDTYGYNLHTPLPLMHQAIELLLKAHASMVDPQFAPKDYGHKTIKILKDYSSEISVFSTITSSQEHMELIAGLEKAWLSVRYAEVIVEYSGSDYSCAGNLANLLSDEYFKMHNVCLQSHHFNQTRDSST